MYRVDHVMKHILNAFFSEYINDKEYSTKFIHHITYAQEFNVLPKI